MKTEIKKISVKDYYKDYKIDNPEYLNIIHMVLSKTFRKGRLVDIYMPVFKKPIEILHKNVKYRVVATHPNYAISSEGDLIDLVAMKIFKRLYTENSYPSRYVDVDESGINQVRISIHRAVAIAWIHNDDYYHRWIVNHIDGNKSNYKVSNLEWNSSSENNRHAFKHGLRKDNYFVKTRNVVTGEVKYHNSMTEATNYMGRSRINTNDVDFLGTGRTTKGTNGEFELKRADDITKWYSEMGIKPALLFVTNTKFIVRELSTGIDKTFKSVRDIIAYIKAPKSTIRKSINSNGAYIVKGYVIKRKDKKPFSPLVEVKNYPVIVTITNNDTGEINTFYSLRKAALHIGCDRKILKLYSNENGPYKNYTIIIKTEN